MVHTGGLHGLLFWVGTHPLPLLSHKITAHRTRAVAERSQSWSPSRGPFSHSASQFCATCCSTEPAHQHTHRAVSEQASSNHTAKQPATQPRERSRPGSNERESLSEELVILSAPLHAQTYQYSCILCERVRFVLVRLAPLIYACTRRKKSTEYAGPPSRPRKSHRAVASKQAGTGS
jgi:hypothetical protein